MKTANNHFLDIMLSVLHIIILVIAVPKHWPGPTQLCHLLFTLTLIQLFLSLYSALYGVLGSAGFQSAFKCTLNHCTSSSHRYGCSEPLSGAILVSQDLLLLLLLLFPVFIDSSSVDSLLSCNLHVHSVTSPAPARSCRVIVLSGYVLSGHAGF